MESLRLAELIAALSVATDLGMANPAESGLRSCILSVELGGALGVDESTLVETFYVALLRLVGCSSEAHTEVEVFGDELGQEGWVLTVESQPLPMMRAIVAKLGAKDPPARRARRVARALANIWRMSSVSRAHCEVACLLAQRLGLGTGVEGALRRGFERWDGRGTYRARGEDTPLSARLVNFAQDVVFFMADGGLAAAIGMAHGRSGTGHDPAIVAAFLAAPERLTGGINEGSVWTRVLDIEPGPRPTLAGAAIDRSARAMADFADLKSPSLSGHSSGVADLTVAAAAACDVPEAELPTLRRAALLHDLGRAGVSAAIWNKPGRLTEGEWERVRLHPYYTERVLARLPALAPVAALASMHHERLDGSGYHRGMPAQMLTAPARLLAAADAYHAMCEARPHRPALTQAQAVDELRREAAERRLCPDAVAAVLGAAGHATPPRRRAWPSGLSDREVEVLRLLARGCSNRTIATRLVVSERTVHHHVEHIYDKIDVSTRAGATLFAVQNDLVGLAAE